MIQTAVFNDIDQLVSQVKEIGGASNMTDLDIKRAFAEYIASTDFINDSGIDLPWSAIEITLDAGSFEEQLDFMIYDIITGGFKNLTTDMGINFTFSPNVYGAITTGSSSFNLESVLQSKDNITACCVFPNKLMFDSIPSIDNVFRIQCQKSFINFSDDIEDSSILNIVVGKIAPAFRYMVLYGVCLLIATKFSWSNVHDLEKIYNKFLLRIKQPRRASESRNAGGQRQKL